MGGVHVACFLRGKGGSKKRKNLSKCVFFRGLPKPASISPIWRARGELKNTTPRFRKSVFSWFAHMGLYVTHVGGKGGSKKRKNDVLESVVFRGLPVRASMSFGPECGLVYFLPSPPHG